MTKNKNDYNTFIEKEEVKTLLSKHGSEKEIISMPLLNVFITLHNEEGMIDLIIDENKNKQRWTCDNLKAAFDSIKSYFKENNPLHNNQFEKYTSRQQAELFAVVAEYGSIF